MDKIAVLIHSKDTLKQARMLSRRLKKFNFESLVFKDIRPTLVDDGMFPIEVSLVGEYPVFVAILSQPFFEDALLIAIARQAIYTKRLIPVHVGLPIEPPDWFPEFSVTNLDLKNPKDKEMGKLVFPLMSRGL